MIDGCLEAAHVMGGESCLFFPCWLFHSLYFPLSLLHPPIFLLFHDAGIHNEVLQLFKYGPYQRKLLHFKSWSSSTSSWCEAILWDRDRQCVYHTPVLYFELQ